MKSVDSTDFHSFLLGASGMFATALTSWAHYYNVLTGVLGFISLIAGAVTGLFTGFIAIRRWHRGFRMENFVGAEKRERKEAANTRRNTRRRSIRRRNARDL